MYVSLALRVALLMSFIFVAGPPSEASAAACSKTCGSQVRQCAQDARPSGHDCREECRSNALRREARVCEDGCRQMQRMAKKTCRSGRSGCMTACKSGANVSVDSPGDATGSPSGPAPTTAADKPAAQPDKPNDGPDAKPNQGPGANNASCMGQCGQQLGRCAHDAASQGPSCIKGCKSAADRQACIQGCTSNAQGGHDECKREARECREDCGFPPSTTTTLDGNTTTTLPETTTTLPETTTTTLPETTTTTLPETTTTTIPDVTTTTVPDTVPTTTLPDVTTTTVVDATTTTIPDVTTTTLPDVTTTTTPDVTTTTVITASACPNVGELTLYAGIGQFCDSNADCPVGTCENDGRCHTITTLDSGWTGLGHDSDINDEVVTRGLLDCPGSGPVCGQCNVVGIDPSTGSCRCANNIRTVCDQPFTADADDCGGAVCDCYLGAPFPLSSGGTPVCVLNRFSQDISGTVNVDEGSGSIDADLRARVFLGASTTSPCNPCGGRCLNDASFCNRDEDCPGSTCTLDTQPGDGVREGVCTTGEVAGQTCDPTGYNSSFPAFVTSTGPGGGWYSLDCPPDVGKNISGGGLIIGLTQTTGTSQLAANVSCGGQSPQLNCPCMQCSGDPTFPCNSNAECATMQGSCSLALSRKCSTDAECDNVDAGNCSTIGRCQAASSINCTTNADCDAVDVGTCNPSTCSVKGPGSSGEFPLPNGCIDLLCSDVGNGEGECTVGPDTFYCDGVVKANGVGILSCLSDEDCVPGSVGIDAGSCTLSQRADCFLDPIVATGDPDPETPVGVATFCIPPTSNSGINTVAGLPGPGRIVSQTTSRTFCSTDPNVQYIPGVGGCPP
jgi:hypothetical protein